MGIMMSMLIAVTMLPVMSFAAGLPFTDVAEDAWYYNDVKEAYDTGLISGMTHTTFEPESYMTYAQAVKLAACMHQKYTTGAVTLAVGSPTWYSTYVDYAKANQIISKDYAWNVNATRADYVDIFAHALPDAALPAKNAIPDGSIPDVKSSHPQAASIYKMYRAGIVIGSDSAGTFRPDSNIKRSEVAAILTRMMDEGARKPLTLTVGEPGETFTVRFNSNGGSKVRPQYVAKNGTAVQPANPAREGYVFIGWYTDTGLTKQYYFTTEVTADITLYAKWATVGSTVTVQFDTGGGSPVPAQTIPANGQATRPENPTRGEYRFAGWYSDSACTQAYSFIESVPGDLTLYAKWEAYGSYTVQFDADGGSAVSAQQVGEYGKAAKPADPTREGYDFLGWYMNSEKTKAYPFDSVVNSDLTLYAKWIDNGRKGTIDDSWSQIIASANDGTYRSKYKIGDTKSIYLGSEGYVEMQIVDFDADELADGSGRKAAITWLSKQVLPTMKMMNPVTEYVEGGGAYKIGTGAVGGWENCQMRNVYMKELAAMLPSEVRTAVKPVIKYTMTRTNSNWNNEQVKNDVPTVDELWIPSYREMIGYTAGSNSLETKGPVYTAVFPDEQSRMKHVASNESVRRFWLRSSEDARCFYSLYGSPTRNTSDWSSEVDPFLGAPTAHYICFGFCM